MFKAEEGGGGLYNVYIMVKAVGGGFHYVYVMVKAVVEASIMFMSWLKL